MLMNVLVRCLPSRLKSDHGKTSNEDVGGRDKLFMVCTLAPLKSDHASVRDQILGSPNVPTLDEDFPRLFCLCSLFTGHIAPKSSGSARRGTKKEQVGDCR